MNELHDAVDDCRLEVVAIRRQLAKLPQKSGRIHAADRYLAKAWMELVDECMAIEDEVIEDD